MPEPETLWLSVTNVLLGIVAGLCFLAVAFTVVYEIAGRIKRRVTLSAELDRDMQRLVGTSGTSSGAENHNRRKGGDWKRR